MTEIIIHVGMHKAGSTTIQDFLELNKPVLHNQDIDYPNIGQAMGMCCPCHRYISAFARGVENEYPENFEEQLQSFFQSQSASKLIFSSEDFYFCAKSKHNKLERHLALMPQAAIRVVAVARNPRTHLKSLYGMSTRAPSYLLTLEEFLAEQTQLLINDAKFSYYRYLKNLEIWRTVGDLSIIRLEDGDLIDQFIRSIGLKGNFSRPVEPSNRTPPYLPSLLCAINCMLKEGVISTKDHKAIAKRIKGGDSSRTFLINF